jgi:hypothetical protein
MRRGAKRADSVVIELPDAWEVVELNSAHVAA